MVKSLLPHLPGLGLLGVTLAIFAGAVLTAQALETRYLNPPDERAGLHPLRPTPTAAVRPTEASTRAPIGVQSIPNARIVFYDIQGDSVPALRAQMTALGPIDAGQHVDALTEWHADWTWPGYGQTNCQLQQAKVTWQISVQFPRWQPTQPADAQLKARWETYTQRLATHEKGHIDNIIKGQRSVLQAIQRATCGTAEAAAQRALDKLRSADQAYDRRTQHGATQGATFP